MKLHVVATALTSILVLGSLCTVAGAAGDPDPLVREKEYVPKAVDASARPEGWTPTLKVGGTLAFAQSSNIVGQIDGASLAFGFLGNGGAAYNHEASEWRNVLKLAENFAKTPSIREYIKSADDLLLESIYLYHFWEKLGPFARLNLDTPIFTGWDVRDKQTTYVITRLNGTTETEVTDLLRLTKPFQPLTLKQSVGAFYWPFSEKYFGLESRLGLGARETFADGALVLNDNKDTADVVEATEIESFQQVGIEFVTVAKGLLSEDRVNYETGVELLAPFWNSKSPNVSGQSSFDLTSVQFYVQLGFKLVSWASVDYEFRTLRDPQIVDEWQMRNSLLLTLSYSFFEPEKPAGEPAK